MSRPPTAAGPARSTPVAERALAPDLARGAMLLLIALANTPWFLYATRPGAVQMHPTPGSVADSIVQAVIITTTDGRAYPMFAFLFAYGIGQLYARQTASGTPPKQARRLLRVRHLWMIVIGAAHAFLLWAGDIIGVYGLVGLVLVPLFFGRKDATIKVWLIILFVFGAIMSVLSLLSGAFAPAGAGPPGNPMAEARIGISDPDYLSSALARITGYVFTLPMMAFLLLSIPTAFLCGILASRHRILDEPGRHLPLLRRVAVIGVGVGWLGGAATAAEHLGGPSVAHGWAYFVPQFYTGVFAGIGYAAAFGLAAHAIARAPPARRRSRRGNGGARPTLTQRLPRPVDHVRTAALGLGSRPRRAPLQLVDGVRRHRRLAGHAGAGVPDGASRAARPGRSRAPAARLSAAAPSGSRRTERLDCSEGPPCGVTSPNPPGPEGSKGQ